MENVSGGILMGQVYQPYSTIRTTTAGQLVFSNGGSNVIISNEPQPLQYVISEAELNELQLEAEPLEISFHGQRAYRFVAKKGSKRHQKEIEKKLTTVGCVYFIKSCGDYKIGSSNVTRIKRRVMGQCPDEILAISKPRTKFREYEKQLHKKFAAKRVLKYEIFKNLTKDEINWIIKELGGINVDMTSKGSRRR